MSALRHARTRAMTLSGAHAIRTAQRRCSLLSLSNKCGRMHLTRQANGSLKKALRFELHHEPSARSFTLEIRYLFFSFFCVLMSASLFGKKHAGAINYIRHEFEKKTLCMNDGEENPCPTRVYIRRMRLPMTTSRKFRDNYRIFRHDLQPCVEVCLQIPYYASCWLAIRWKLFVQSDKRYYRIRIIV